MAPEGDTGGQEPPIDPDDLSAFVPEVRAPLVRHLVAIGFRPEIAEDAVQEALIEGHARWRAAGSWAAAGITSPKGWLTETARHAAGRTSRSREVPSADVADRPVADRPIAPSTPTDPDDLEVYLPEQLPLLIASLRKCGTGAERAEWAAHEAMAAALRRLRTCGSWRAGGVRRPRTWIWRAAHACIAGPGGPPNPVEEQPWRPPDDADPDLAADVELYDAVVRDLPPTQRRVFVLVQDGFEPRDIADILDQPRVATVRSNARHAREAVKARLTRAVPPAPEDAWSPQPSDSRRALRRAVARISSRARPGH